MLKVQSKLLDYFNQLQNPCVLQCYTNAALFLLSSRNAGL